ncbi:MAG: flagellar type III secretion system pore protein FliP [Deltaproteobacteria bacterium]|nr:flagellar type III secretion system pore protein FliP [Deltaproteobacteria bacterium]
MNPTAPSAPGLAGFIDTASAMTPAGGSAAVKLFLLMTLLSFATAILTSVTCFIRIAVVMSFLRQALGTPQLPPTQVMMGLSLFLTIFIMTPTARAVHEKALEPLFADKITLSEALERSEEPVRAFLAKHTHDEEIRLFYEVSGRARPSRGEVVPMSVMIPAFMVSELTTSFKMGLFIFIPMLVIDVLVAAILMSLGMMMVPPQMVSLPLKVGVFLVAGGWHLVVSALVRSFA